jgi:hypothetical protein
MPAVCRRLLSKALALSFVQGFSLTSALQAILAREKLSAHGSIVMVVVSSTPFAGSAFGDPENHRSINAAAFGQFMARMNPGILVRLATASATSVPPALESDQRA